MRTILYSIVVCLALTSAAAQEKSPTIQGYWLTEDHSAVVLVMPCAYEEEQICGYLVGYGATGNTNMDRALCRFRVFGGLVERGHALVDGWLFDLESDKAYNLSIKMHQNGRDLMLTVSDNAESRGETVTWSRIDHKQNNFRAPPELKICTLP